MKYSLAFLLTIVLIPLCSAAENESDRKAIEQTIAVFVQSGDLQDPDLAAKALHPRFTQYLDMGKGISRSSRDVYQNALRAKAIGGEKRQFEVEQLDITANTAFAKVIIHGGHFRFTDYVTLMKNSRGWEIVSITLSVRPGK